MAPPLVVDDGVVRLLLLPLLLDLAKDGRRFIALGGVRGTISSSSFSISGMYSGISIDQKPC